MKLQSIVLLFSCLVLTLNNSMVPASVELPLQPSSQNISTLDDDFIFFGSVTGYGGSYNAAEKDANTQMWADINFILHLGYHLDYLDILLQEEQDEFEYLIEFEAAFIPNE